MNSMMMESHFDMNSYSFQITSIDEAITDDLQQEQFSLVMQHCDHVIRGTKRMIQQCSKACITTFIITVTIFVLLMIMIGCIARLRSSLIQRPIILISLIAGGAVFVSVTGVLCLIATHTIGNFFANRASNQLHRFIEEENDKQQQDIVFHLSFDENFILYNKLEYLPQLRMEKQSNL
jgi:hypothetical protein